MPHVIIKLAAGRSEPVKKNLADQIAEAVKSVLKTEDKSISVAIEDVKPEDWAEEVYRPDILNRRARLYKEPGCNPIG